MAWKSSADRYGRVAIAIHWASAIGVAALIASGLLASGEADDGAKADLLRFHAAAGAAVVLLTLGRLIWWRLADTKPQGMEGNARWQEVAAKLVHWLFYAVVLGIGLTGAGMLLMSDAIPLLLGGSPGPLPDFHQYPPRLGHGSLNRLLFVLLAMHVGAAIHHQFVRRDRILARMGVGRRSSENLRGRGA